MPLETMPSRLPAPAKKFNTERRSSNPFRDRSLNKYTFVGNLKRPFDTINWLSPKAASDKEDCGFLFFENHDGYHFRSIKKLLEQKPKKKYRRLDKNLYETDSLNILDARVSRTNDIGMIGQFFRYCVENSSVIVYNMKI